MAAGSSQTSGGAGIEGERLQAGVDDGAVLGRAAHHRRPDEEARVEGLGRGAVAAATNRLGFGDKIRLIPGHCDPTVNLYDWYVGIRANRVEQLWPITAGGAVC